MKGPEILARVLCPTTNRISDIPAATVTIWLTTDNVGHYTYTCPKCGDTHAHHANKYHISMWARHATVTRVPAEALEPRPGGQPFTTDDILDLWNELA